MLPTSVVCKFLHFINRIEMGFSSNWYTRTVIMHGEHFFSRALGRLNRRCFPFVIMYVTRIGTPDYLAWLPFFFIFSIGSCHLVIWFDWLLYLSLIHYLSTFFCHGCFIFPTFSNIKKGKSFSHYTIHRGTPCQLWTI